MHTDTATLAPRADGYEGSAIASAAALDVSGLGDFFHVTGTTTITSISARSAGSPLVLVFDGALTFTHHSTNLILPGGVNITTVAGDVAVLRSESSSGTWRCVSYTRANGGLVVGSVAGAAAIKGIYVSSTVAVAVPTIADAETDEVAVDVAAAFTVQPAVGDAVIAIPTGALPTSCILNGAYVSATDTVKVSFGTLEGGAGVTGANVNFVFLVIDLT